MRPLESIVLPFEQSRALVDAGIVLDTVATWQRNLVRADHEINVHIVRDNSIYGIEDAFENVCPAPVLSELLDAIRAKVGGSETTAILSSDKSEAGVSCAGIRTAGGKYEIAQASTDILAAAELLIEISAMPRKEKT